jgi:hypothetical protein
MELSGTPLLMGLHGPSHLLADSGGAIRKIPIVHLFKATNGFYQATPNRKMKS